uniref:arylamine N-acetyltransferase n=1 Tax=Ciona intestinalis TaxID=7719 RepID=F6VMU0_CIOIN|nr:arylamine N-acetyltransferase, pineal gland isozyme NAT-3 [Ciona intestinalis]|eukprot:XP_009862490.1 arylamine N-acetyltransferase, pineal gland isozyme NAT-3 [Ciona intestinalis]
MNVKEYLQRINYSGDVAPTSSNLRKICVAHMLAVPYENLDVFGGPPITIDLPKLFEKIVKQRRGGFNFELNRMFCWLLQNLGYQVSLYKADVYNMKLDAFTYTQPALVVTVDDGSKYFTDIAFTCGTSLTEPLNFEYLTEQAQKLGVFRLRECGKTSFYFELKWFHVVDSTGEVNPATDIEFCFGESKYRSKGWIILYKVSMDRQCTWDELVPELERFLNNNEKWMTRNTICAINRGSSVTVLWGKYLIQKYIREDQQRGDNLTVSRTFMELSDFPAILEIIRCVFGMKSFTQEFTPIAEDITTRPIVIY